MLICIADSEYFNIALKAYINEPNSKPLDIKEILCYPFSGQSEMFYTFFATDAGARLSTILIDYSSVSIEVLQVALSLKSFNPLIRIFIFAKSGGNDSNLLIVFYVQIMPDDFVMQLHRF
ncbi:response regulator (activator) in two-component regulatory system wtih UhpB [Klebsiella pneumoniae]|nr:response regulator (activator) in two-component regulatory system wtih UhpB [Klebsiella pneumoniae]